VVHCYFHIGWPKTGSSAIQNFCSHNRVALASQHGVLYPNFATDQLNEGDENPDHGHIAHAKADQIESVLNRTIDFAERKGYGKLVISSESLRQPFCNGIATLLDRPGVEVSIIAYLRRQDHLIESAWKQWFFKSEFANIDAFADDLIGQAPLENGLWAYEAILRRWTDVLGKERLILRAYEKAQLVGDDVVADFRDAIGIDPKARFSFATDAFTNTGFNRDVMELAGLCKQLHADIHDPRLTDMLEVALPENFRKQPFEEYDLLSPAKRDDILKAFDQENQTIAKTYLARDDGKLFLEDWPDRDAPWDPYQPDLEKIVPILMQVLMDQHQRLNAVEKPLSRIHALLTRFFPMAFLPQISFRQWLAGRYRPKRDMMVIRKSKLFDAEYYLKKNPDIASKDRDPLWHYALYGWTEGRNPNANFNTAAYLLANPAVAKRGGNPFVHYIESLSRHRTTDKKD
jgi:hypothetical protein